MLIGDSLREMSASSAASTFSIEAEDRMRKMKMEFPMFLEMEIALVGGSLGVYHRTNNQNILDFKIPDVYQPADRLIRFLMACSADDRTPEVMS